MKYRVEMDYPYRTFNRLWQAKLYQCLIRFMNRYGRSRYFYWGNYIKEIKND